MPYPQELEYWQEEVSISFPQMSQRQAEVLALYSYGMAMTQRCGQTVVSVFLSLLLGLKSQNLRQRLKEFTYEAEQKRGKKRREVVVSGQFGALIGWIVKQWQTKKQLVLGVDVTYVKDRYTILCISVLYGQTAIPVAWKVLKGNAKGEWHPLWVDLVAHIAPQVPKTMQVLVLFDRGLYSKRLFEVVRCQAWHPFMRIREQGLFKRPTSCNWQDLKHVAYRTMSPTAFRVTCFKGDPLQAILWVQWDANCHEPCLILSDLAPKQLKGGNPYPLRMWIEAGFKDFKRGGFRLEQSKIPDPARLDRLLFVMAVAIFFLIRISNHAFSQIVLPSDPARRLSLITLGWLHLLVASIHDTPLQESAFRPYHLPSFSPRIKTYP
jgi:hypothetical protein